MPRSGPFSLVMSQLQTSLGRVAMSSGFFFAGWVRWRRRSLLRRWPAGSGAWWTGEHR